MLIFFADGRLGNQIFQYAFLKTIQKENERIIVCGFDDLFNVFDLNDKTIINLPKKNKWIRGFCYRIIKPIIYRLGDNKIITTIQIKYEYFGKYRRETTVYFFKKGMLQNVTLVKTAFFQSEKFFNKKIVNNLKIKKNYLLKAKEFLKPVKENYKVFVHIRRGDYKDFKPFGKDSILPMDYFHKLIKWFLKNKEKVCFVFLSDEPDFIEKEFAYLKNKIISRNSYEIDFAIMTLCNGAILSPSSFGWWGSYLMKDRDIVFAPKYWLGWKSKIEYQKGTIASYMEEIEVNS